MTTMEMVNAVASGDEETDRQAARGARPMTRCPRCGAMVLLYPAPDGRGLKWFSTLGESHGRDCDYAMELPR